MERNRVVLTVFAAIFLAIGPCVASVNAEVYDPAGKRDPFVPIVGVSSSSVKQGLESVITVEDINLQGILIGSGGKKSVIINGEVVDEGYKAGILSVEDIGDNDVKIRIGDEVHEIKLYEKD